MLNRLGLVIHWTGFILGCLAFLGLVILAGLELNQSLERSAYLEELLETAIEEKESYANGSDPEALQIEEGDYAQEQRDILNSINQKLREEAVVEAQINLDSNRTEGFWGFIVILFIAPLALVVSMLPFWAIRFILTAEKVFFPWRKI